MKITMHGARFSDLYQPTEKDSDKPRDRCYGQLEFHSQTGAEKLRVTFEGVQAKDLQKFADVSVPLIVSCELSFGMYGRENILTVRDLDVKVDQESMQRSLEWLKADSKAKTA